MKLPAAVLERQYDANRSNPTLMYVATVSLATYWTSLSTVISRAKIISWSAVSMNSMVFAENARSICSIHLTRIIFQFLYYNHSKLNTDNDRAGVHPMYKHLVAIYTYNSFAVIHKYTGSRSKGK